jgi:nitrogen fixation protein FixH
MARTRSTPAARWVLLVAAALLIAACGPRSASPPTSEGPRAQIDWSPQQPVALRPLMLNVRITDARGRPLDLQPINATASMPEMGHESETVNLGRIGAGRYTGIHTFSMDGAWRLTFEGAADGKPVTVRADVSVGR